MAIDLLPSNPFDILKSFYRKMYLKINELINAVNSPSSGALPISYITGLTINNTVGQATLMDVQAGTCRDSTDTYDIVLTGVKTLDIDGSGLNGIDTGLVADDTLYALYVIARTSDDDTQLICSLDMVSPLMPATYDTFRRIAVIFTTDTGTIFNIFQSGQGVDRFMRYAADQAQLQIESVGIATSYTNTDVTIAVFVPPVATAVEINMTVTKDGGTSLQARGMVNIEGLVDFERWIVQVGVSSTEDIKIAKQFVMPYVAGQQLQYKVQPAGDAMVDIYIGGYMDSL